MPQVNKIYLGESIRIFFAYIYEPMLSRMIDQVFLFFRYSFCIIFLSSSPIEKHKNDILGLYEHSSRKKKHLHHCLASFTQNKIHKNNKMHFYKNYNSTLYNTDSPCWIILFPRHLSYHHTTTTTIRPSWHLMFYIFTGNLSRCFTYIFEFMSLYLAMH